MNRDRERPSDGDGAHRHCPRCWHYFNPPPYHVPDFCPQCGLDIDGWQHPARSVDVTWVSALFLTSALFCVAALPAAMATWRPEYAQLSDKERQWFREQVVPGKNYSCCSAADGAQAQEDTEGDHYRVRFTARNFINNSDIDSGWMNVPPEAVIQKPNTHGAPVVWYYWHPGATPTAPTLMIRCYAPGAKGQQ